MENSKNIILIQKSTKELQGLHFTRETLCCSRALTFLSLVQGYKATHPPEEALSKVPDQLIRQGGYD